MSGTVYLEVVAELKKMLVSQHAQLLERIEGAGNRNELYLLAGKLHGEALQIPNGPLALELAALTSVFHRLERLL